MDKRINQITICLIVCQCFRQYVTENCLQIFTVNLNLEESKIRCQELKGRHLTVDDILVNRMFINQSKNFVTNTRQSVWIDSDNGNCRAFSWNTTEVTIDEKLQCTEKFHPACIFETGNGICIKEPVDDKKPKNSFKTILIAALCGGGAVLVCIMIFIGYCVKARKNRSKGEAHQATSFELKRYRVSEGFNIPVITDDEIKGSVVAKENEMPYYTLEKVGGSENDFNLKRTNDWVEKQNSSLDEIDNQKMCHHLAPSGPSEDGSDSFYRTNVIVAGNLSINNAIDLVRD